mgnify:CR=1 FL=1
MKHYDFDEVIARKGTNCVKHDLLNVLYGRDDLTPMWVADMDFRSPDFVMDALRERCEHEVLGYGIPPEGYWQSVETWFKNHYDIDAQRNTMHFIPGVVAGIAYALLALTDPGDRILVTTPVYPPFLNLPKACGRQLECSPLKVSEGRFAIDWDDLEQRASRCRMLILSNPHNPAGTVWGHDVLQQIADICERHHLTVISDEIHADLTLFDHHHVSYSTVGVSARNHSITFVAPSKTFNIAGLGSSVAYVADEGLRRRFFGWLDQMGVAGGNIFAYTGAQAAFTHGEEWRRQVVDYLQGNVALVARRIQEWMPNVHALLPEASYLVWIDFSALGFSHEELNDRLVTKAHVAMNDGITFGGEAYSQCFRLNIGCPRNTLDEVLRRIADAMK